MEGELVIHHSFWAHTVLSRLSLLLYSKQLQVHIYLGVENKHPMKSVDDPHYCHMITLSETC